MPAGNDRMERVRADLLRRAQAREDMASTRQQQDASYSFAMGAAVPAPLSLPGSRSASPRPSTSSLPDAIANYRQDKPPPRFPAPHPDFAVHGRTLTQQRSLDIVRVGGSGNPGSSANRSGSVPPDAGRGRSSFSSENPGRRGVKVPFALSRDGQAPRRQGRLPHAREAPAVRPIYERNIPIRQVRLPDPPTRAFVRSKLRDVELGDTDNYLSEKGNATTSSKPRKLLFCIPRPESRKVRTALLQSIVSFIFLIGLLGVYAGVTAGGQSGSALPILLLVILLFSAAFFCYSFIRMCLAVRSHRREMASSTSSGTHATRHLHRASPVISSAGSSPKVGAGPYAYPHRPIKVTMRSDEEALGSKVMTGRTKATPPAYGLWKESVRLDPTRLYWQRQDEKKGYKGDFESHTPSNDDAPGDANRADGNEKRRPPSYASDDGVSWVVDGTPRSTRV